MHNLVAHPGAIGSSADLSGEGSSAHIGVPEIFQRGAIDLNIEQRAFLDMLANQEAES
jgi:hypothetical protein